MAEGRIFEGGRAENAEEDG